ncbi:MULTISPECIES: hypothetical protein [unclassified Erythrobacter]|uniref:hypothetical protein n=1 Tax=Erythrobacteraceae TaxID=335929 RepID=UPI00076D5C4E|nr:MULTISPECIES: hypothetical protein [unclassified Erythrobacter]KWV96078.1 hypothetical protein ASS64_02335 [Erythrobacter sp. AP23]MBO6526106.1 hypothetical protein [Erythrobacter sp.]MBO6531180.1 hypothetical protein [Erythrobacter sp.]MBO6768633.1 hypothetical protein [Erythrobacter sp.]
MGFVLMAFGAALMLSGGLWTLQGLGLVMWPADSFMLAEREWALYGAITFMVGLFLFRSGSRRG